MKASSPTTAGELINPKRTRHEPLLAEALLFLEQKL